MGVEKCLFLLYCECMGNNRTTLESKVLMYSARYSLYLVIIEPHWNLKKTIAMLRAYWKQRNNRTTLESKVVL